MQWDHHGVWGTAPPPKFTFKEWLLLRINPWYAKRYAQSINLEIRCYRNQGIPVAPEEIEKWRKRLGWAKCYLEGDE